MKKIFLFFAVLLFAFEVFSQYGATSGNGSYIASVVSEAGVKKILIHKFETRELVRKLEFKPAITSAQIDKVVYNYYGSLLGVISKGNLYVFDVMQAKQIALIPGVKDIIFPLKGADYFIVVANTYVARYDAETGKKLFNYYLPSGNKIKKAILSPTENLLAILAEPNKIYIYDPASSKTKKQLSGSDLKFRYNGKYFTVLYSYNELLKVYTYNASTFYQERALSSDAVLKDRPHGKVFPKRSSLSKDGSFVAIYTAKGFNVEIFVFNTFTQKLVWTINNLKNTNNSLYPNFWTTPTVMIGRGEKMMAGEYNVVSHASQTLFLRIDQVGSNDDLTEENQKNNLFFDKYYHYAVLNGKNGMYIRDTRIPQKKFYFDGVKFLFFSGTGKYIFVLKDGVVNILVAKQVTQALQTNGSVKFYPLDKNLKATVPEKYQPDAKPPKGYAYFYVNNTKQIVKLDTAKLHMLLRSVKIDGNNVEIQVNLVDQHGNAFIGAADPSWKYIWCNLILQDPSFNVRQVKDFVVEEKNITVPTAYAIVLDHSGSMGNKRANDLQFGAWQLINKKIGNNAFMLIKYDDKVKVLTGLTTNKALLQRHLNNTGLSGFGGSTALIDAAYIAVRRLAKDTRYKRKVVMLFTDGYENSSFFTKAELLDEAINNNIEIDVIGFGKDVNEEYLKDIAYNTGGIYLHIYKTEDLKKIFRDIDYKSRHYYSIKFRTNVKGKHVALVQLCQDFEKHDSLWVAFDTKAPDLPPEKRHIVPIKKPSIKLTRFEPLIIPRKPKLKPVTNKKVLKDFKNIHFPNILFETGSAKILKNDEKGIDEIVAFMKKYPYVYLEIDGHTDNVGTPEFNMELSKKRAEAAKKLIVAKGIAPARIITKGFGDTKPIASNDTEEGRRLNRRIEFKVLVH